MTVPAERFVVDPVAPRRYSMTFMRAAEGCLRRAHLERECDITGPDALIGRLFHSVVAAVGFTCSMAGRPWMSFDEARPIAVHVMTRASDDGPLPKTAWDTTLSLVARWCDARRAPFRPGEMFEVLSVLPYAGRNLSARIDRIAIDGSTAHVRDYKSGYADPAKDLTMQGELYAWHVLTANPHLDTVVYSEEHARFGLEGGPWRIDRYDIERTEEWLAAAIHRIDAAYATGTLPATPGSACSSPGRCPVASSCPVPKWARPATVIETAEDAAAQFEALLVEEAVAAARKDLIRGWLEHSGERALQLAGEEIGRATKPGKRFNRTRLAAAIAAADVVIDLDEFDEPSTPSFGRRKAKGDES